MLHGNNDLDDPVYTAGMPPVRAPRSSGTGIALLLAGGLALVGAATAIAGGSDSTPAKPRPTSFAPHHTRSHVYGTPVSKPILHKRKKRTQRAAPAAAPAPPVK